MSGRALRWASLVVGLVALGFILVSATVIDRRPPEVASIALSRTAGDPAVALTHAAIDISFSESVVQPSAERRVRIAPSVDGSFSWADERTLVFTPAEQLPTATDFTITVEPGYLDRAGNAATEASPPFAFRTVGLPTVVSTLPAVGARDVPLNAAITLQFDRLMDTERTSAAVRLEPAVGLRTAWSGTTLIATPEAPLAPSTTYQLRVEPTAADTDGNSLAAPYAVQFTTIATGLSVVDVVPRDGSAGAPLDGPIAVQFDAALDPASLDGSITVTPTVGGTVRAEAAPRDPSDPAAAQTLLVFDADMLAPHTTYTVQLAAGVVRSAEGDQVAAGRTWRFTTGAPPAVLQNQILFLSERGGARNVWAMNPDGTNARALTTELAPVVSFDATPDGRSLVYAVAGTVRLMRLPEGTVTTITAANAAEYSPRLAPDGTAIAVWRRARDTEVDEGLWLVPLGDEGAPRQLLGEGAPAVGSSASRPAVPAGETADAAWLAPVTFSGDGATLLAVTASGDASIVAVAALSVERTGITDVVGPPAWLPRTARFAISGTRGDDEGVWLVEDDGDVTPGPQLRGWPAAAVDGGLVGQSATGSGLLEYAPRTGTPRAITAGEEFEDRQPRFGPGGDTVVFVRVPRGEPDRSAGIWVVRTDGLELRQLSPDGTDPRWLP